MRRVYSVAVFEALRRDRSPKFGAHIVALMPTAPARDKLIEILNGSAYGEHVLAEPVVDWPGLTTYLLKEATPQAWYGARKGFRRVGGSIPLGARGGDRGRRANIALLDRPHRLAGHPGEGGGLSFQGTCLSRTSASKDAVVRAREAAAWN
jgi:hypothetical protein